MSKPVIISGEASETDSDDETPNNKKHTRIDAAVQGAVITGEDSESENENDRSIASAVSALNDFNIQTNYEETNKYESLFHQKLREGNARLQTDLENFCHHTVEEAQKSLDNIDQHLLKSQITLQGAVTSLKALSISSLTIKNKLHSILTAKFLQNVNTSLEKQTSRSDC